MSSYLKRIGEQSFAPVTSVSTAVTSENLYPEITTGAPAFFLGQPGAMAQVLLNEDTTEYIINQGMFNDAPTLDVNFKLVPLFGEGPYTVRLSPMSTRTRDDDGVSIPAPDPVFVDFPFALQELTLTIENWGGWKFTIEDSTGQLVPLDKVLFSSYSMGGGSWESKPIRLSSILLSVEYCRPISMIVTYYDSGRPRFGGYEETLHWTKEFRGTRGEVDVTEWSTSLPTPEEIYRNSLDGIRIRLTHVGGVQGQSHDIVRYIELLFTEEYATQNPSRPITEEDNNLYVPKLRVLLNGQTDVSAYVSSFGGNNLGIVAPDDRFDSLISNNPTVLVILDENTAFEGRVIGATKRSFITGISYEMQCQSYYDMLSNKMDEDILGADTDGDGKMELPFRDDLGYIAFISQTLQGVNQRPVIYENQGFRPISAWYQGNGTEPFVKPVKLDADYDWYQIYSTRNQSARGKLKDIAAANFYNFSSVAGRPLLAPMIPAPFTSVERMAVVTYNVTGIGTYLPEARLYVPDYEFDISSVPKSLEIQGLAQATPADVDDPEEIARAYVSQEDEIRDYYLLESSGGAVQEEWLFVDSANNNAVFQRGTVEITQTLKTDLDINICTDARAMPYELIDASEYPDHAPGYDGIIGVRVGIQSGVFVLASLTVRATGIMLYSASGNQGEPPKSEATGDYFPTWVGGPATIDELGNYASRMPKDKETIVNEFLTTYALPSTDEELATWNQNLVDAGRKAMYGKDTHGYYLELEGYILHERAMSKLADAYALERLLGVLTINFQYVGHAGLKHGDIFGIARRPASGVNGTVEHIDYFLVLEDFSVNFQAGGLVTSSFRAGYVGTRVHNEGAWTFGRNIPEVDWQEKPVPSNEIFYF